MTVPVLTNLREGFTSFKPSNPPRQPSLRFGKKKFVKKMENKPLYEKYLKAKHWENHPTKYAESFANFLKEVKFKGLVVDLGCGNGRDVNVFSDLGFNASGIDYSEEEIKNAKKEFLNLKFEVKNIENTTFKDESIGALFIINVIHYLNKEKAIKEMWRILKPKGYLYIHFNISIVDKNGKIDYNHKEEHILKLISNFKILHKNIFKRVDKLPIEHTHTVMELILQKP